MLLITCYKPRGTPRTKSVWMAVRLLEKFCKKLCFLRVSPGKHCASQFTGFTRKMQFCFAFFSILYFLYFYFTILWLWLDQTLQGRSYWTVCCHVAGHRKEHSRVSLVLFVASYLCFSEIQVVIVSWPNTWKATENKISRLSLLHPDPL